MEKKHLQLMQKVAHEVWQKYDDEFGYRSDKQRKNKEMETHIPTNIWFFFGQFDPPNQVEFILRVGKLRKSKTRDEVYTWCKKQLNDSMLSILGVK